MELVISTTPGNFQGAFIRAHIDFLHGGMPAGNSQTQDTNRCYKMQIHLCVLQNACYYHSRMLTRGNTQDPRQCPTKQCIEKFFKKGLKGGTLCWGQNRHFFNGAMYWKWTVFNNIFFLLKYLTIPASIPGTISCSTTGSERLSLISASPARGVARADWQK